MNTIDSLMRLAAVIESRKPANGGNPDASYVARLLHSEEATETVMAAKDLSHGSDPQHLVNEMADLWFHCMVALAHYGLSPQDVINELSRREGLGGLEEKALRKALQRESGED